eukprot:6203117-Pleurochrysis_carterae.AAC.1
MHAEAPPALGGGGELRDRHERPLPLCERAFRRSNWLRGARPNGVEDALRVAEKSAFKSRKSRCQRSLREKCENTMSMSCGKQATHSGCGRV